MNPVRWVEKYWAHVGFSCKTHTSKGDCPFSYDKGEVQFAEPLYLGYTKERLVPDDPSMGMIGAAKCAECICNQNGDGKGVRD